MLVPRCRRLTALLVTAPNKGLAFRSPCLSSPRDCEHNSRNCFLDLEAAHPALPTLNFPGASIIQLPALVTNYDEAAIIVTSCHTTDLIVHAPNAVSVVIVSPGATSVSISSPLAEFVSVSTTQPCTIHLEAAQTVRVSTTPTTSTILTLLPPAADPETATA